MSVGVFTPDIRIEFVNGWLTGGTDPEDGSVECGTGTAFPMSISSLDQLAEILYRVKDAYFTGGSASWQISGSTQTINAPTYAPVNRRVDINSLTYQQRGYCKLGADDYNQAIYDAGIGYYYSDIGDNEKAIWRNAWNDGNHIDAFSYKQDDPYSTQGGDAEWWGNSGLGAYAEVFRGNRVAVIKNNPEDGLYAPTNQFFLEIEMYWYDYGVVPFGGSTNIYNSKGGFGNFSARAVLICKYILRLQSGDVEANVYFDALGSSSETGTDFIHQPSKWWPYAKDSPAVPVWNTETGAKL